MSEAKNPIPGVGFNPALFREPQRALQDLEVICAGLPADLTTAVLGLLSDSPDPDQALSFCERLVAQSGEPLIRLLDRKRVLLHYAIVVFGHSYWLGEALLRNFDLLDSLATEKNLERSLDREDYRQRLAALRSGAFPCDISSFLARFKKREYIRIALRDALGIATLAETAEEISALADTIIAEALAEAESMMRDRPGGAPYSELPKRSETAAFTVIALGKLGGNELNYSSDVDLLYLYSAPESAESSSLREYFIRLAQLLTEILSCFTPEGPVFRIDLRLRPQGHEGEPVLELRHGLDYYAHVAHDWELQALIKARHAAGDAALARGFIRGVQRQVYSEDLNFAAIATALNSREKIGGRRRGSASRGKRPATIDVKLDRGGIRDVEFLVQCLQRVYGGAEPWLCTGGTLFSLQKLHDKGHLSSRDFHELTVAYEFLRKVEHRLQLQRGRQVHRLPAEAEELEVLHRAVSRGRREEDAETFLSTLKSRMARVAEIYDSVIHIQRSPELSGQREGLEVAPVLPEVPAYPPLLDQPWQRAAAAFPTLAAVAARSDLSLHARRSVHRYLRSAMTSGERQAGALDNPELLRRAVALFESSDYLTDALVQHPGYLRVLEEVPGASAHERDAYEQLATLHPAPGLNEGMAVLRQGFRKRALIAGARDILGSRPALESMRETTAMAEAAIRAALHIVAGEDTLSVLALGRLGTQEFDIASDADLLFVRDPQTSADQARAVAERVIHVLAAFTRDGALFPVDARLRPRGGEGELVVTPAQLDKYLADAAQPWEALTYTKLRFIAGTKDIAERTLPVVWRRIAEMAPKPDFPRQVLEMRSRLERSNRFPRSFKLARGGFYDIDFIVSFLLLRRGLLGEGNTLDRLQHLQESGVLQQAPLALLQEATLLYRTLDHVIRLVTGRARPELPEAEHARHATVALANTLLGREAGNDLQAELGQSQEAIRRIFIDLIGN